MPRPIPQEALDKLAQATGLEPVNIIRIQWVIDGPYYYYSDRKIKDKPEILGKLISLAQIENVVTIDKGTTSVSIKIQLDDTDGVIKNIFDYNDINNRSVVVYQWFDSADFSINYMFPIFEGVIATPIEWDEGTRVIVIDAISLIDDREVGFSVEDGDFTDIPDILIGKAWPLVFGTVADMPALKMDDIPTGTTLVPVSIADHNLHFHVNYVNNQNLQQVAKATCLMSRAAELYQLAINAGLRDHEISKLPEEAAPVSNTTVRAGDFTPGRGFTAIYEQPLPSRKTNGNNNVAQSYYDRSIQARCQAQQILRQINGQNAPLIQNLQNTLIQQQLHDTDVINIVNGHLFLQGQQIEIKINDAKFVGSFQGDNFHVVARTKPKDIERNLDYTPSLSSSIDTIPSTGLLINDGDCGGMNDKSIGSESYWACEPPWIPQPTTPINTPTRPQSKGESWFAQAGASVTVGAGYPIRYILSITPGTTVLWLSARATQGGFKRLTVIPSNYYSISTITLGSVQALIATFSQPLSTYENIDYDNEVYATLQSSIGPNVIDILTWLIDNYTQYSVDATSFNYVRNKLLNYPANFALLEKKNVVTLLKEIAWQSRCSIWLTGGKFYIKYLPEQATSVDIITEDDIESETLKIVTTPTEDVVTKFIAEWRYSYANDVTNKVIKTYNINKYGIKQQSYDFYIYNEVSLVDKSATFWLIRLANIWKKVQCRCMLNRLKAETMDNITVDLAHHPHANVAVVGVVDGATFDSENYSIDFDVWLPVRLGEMLPYDFAYPANVATTLVFPTAEDIAGGFTANNDNQQAAGATGSLNSKTPSNQGGGRTRKTQRPVADATDNTEPEPPFMTTTTRTPSAASATETPSNDYSLADLTAFVVRAGIISAVQVQPIINGTYDGVVLEKIDGQVYKGLIFQGDEEGVSVEVIAKRIDPADTLPSGTPGTIIEQVEKSGDTAVTRYYFQLPTYVAAPEE